MCKSLAEGGLRCYSHVQNDMANLEKKYHESLQEAITEAKIPFDSDTLRKTKVQYEYEMAKAKDVLLLAHQAAIEAKNGKGFTVGSTNSLPKYTSIANDLASVRSRIKARFDRLVEIGEGAPTNSQILDKNPALNKMAGKQDYINAIHLYSMYASQIKKMKDQNLLNSSASFSYDPIELQNDNTSREHQLEALESQRDSLIEYMRPFRQEYSAYQREMPYEAKQVAVLEGQISGTPRPSSKELRKLDYKIKVDTFKHLKDTYEKRAKRGYDSREEVAKYIGHSTTPMYDQEALKKFTENYDKTGEGAEIKMALAKKKQQMYLTTTYRNHLETKAESLKKVNRHEEAQELLEKKAVLDKMADKKMAKNRQRAAMNQLADAHSKGLE